MLLGEPPRTQFDLNFSLFGVPVRVHPLFWIMGLLMVSMGSPHSGPAKVLVWMTAFFLGILCHEIGHALVMRSQGCWPWITLYGLGGVTSCDRMRRLRTAGAESLRQIAISAAGPLAGFLVAAVAIGLVWALRHWALQFDLRQHPHFVDFIYSLLFVTIVYGILNLLPIYPLDGGQIARELFVLIFGPEGIRHSLILSVVTAGGLAVLSAIKWHQIFLALLFGYLAFASFATLQAYGGRRR